MGYFTFLKGRKKKSPHHTSVNHQKFLKIDLRRAIAQTNFVKEGTSWSTYTAFR